MKSHHRHHGRPTRPQRPMGIFFAVWSITALGCNILQKQLYVAYSFKFYVSLGLLSLAVTSFLVFAYACCSGMGRHLPHLTRLGDPNVVMQMFGDFISFLVIALSVCFECVGSRIGLGELTMGGVAVVEEKIP